MRKIIICIFLCFSTYLLKAESENFKYGYIITLKNDTVFGLINFGTDANNALYCRYKETDTGIEIKYEPGSIQSYYFIETGKLYVSKKIEALYEQKEIFLEFLIKGIMNVYYYDDGIQPSFIFEDQDGRVNVVTKESMIQKDGVFYQNMKYDKQLREIFTGFVPNYYNSKPIRFDQTTIIGMAKSYHDSICTTGEECIIFENRHPDAEVLKLKFSAYSGVSHFNYFLNTINYVNDGSGRIYNNFSPQIGFIMDVYYPRLSKSVSMVFDVSYTGFSTPMRYIYSSVEAESSGNVLISKAGLKFKFFKSNIRPYIEFGGGYAVLLNTNIKLKKYVLDVLAHTEEYTSRKNAPIIYSGVGIEQRIGKNSAIFLSCNYNNSLIGAPRKKGKDIFSLLQMNVGFTF